MGRISRTEDTGDGFDRVGAQEFEGYLNKKLVGASLKNARRVVLKEMLNRGSWTGPGFRQQFLAMLSLPRAAALEANEEVSMAMLNMREWWLVAQWWLLVLVCTGAMVAHGGIWLFPGEV